MAALAAAAPRALRRLDLSGNPVDAAALVAFFASPAAQQLTSLEYDTPWNDEAASLAESSQFLPMHGDESILTRQWPRRDFSQEVADALRALPQIARVRHPSTCENLIQRQFYDDRAIAWYCADAECKPPLPTNDDRLWS